MATIDPTRETVTVTITPSTTGSPAGKLADAELRFAAGPLAGLKLIGFGVWEGRHGRHVTFPARQYSVNGARRSFTLLRPIADRDGTKAVRDLILQAYADEEATEAPPAGTD